MNYRLLLLFSFFSIQGADRCDMGMLYNEIQRFNVAEELVAHFSVDNSMSGSGLFDKSLYTQFDPLSMPTYEQSSAQAGCRFIAKPESFAKVDKLIYSGDEKALKEMYGECNSWLSTFSFNVRENKAIAKYIRDALDSKHFPLFVKLHECTQPAQARSVLKEIIDSTPDRLVHVEAIIAADTIVGGIICEYGNTDLLLSDRALDPQTDLMCTFRLGQHQINKVIPHGIKNYSQDMRTFSQRLNHIVQSVPESIRESLLAYAVQGFIETTINPVPVAKDHLSKIRTLAVALYDDLLATSLKPEDYNKCREYETGKLFHTFSQKVKGYSQKEWARVVGSAVSQQMMATVAVKGAQYIASGAHIVGSNLLSHATRSAIPNSSGVVVVSQAIPKAIVSEVATTVTERAGVAIVSSGLIPPELQLEDLLSKSKKQFKSDFAEITKDAELTKSEDLLENYKKPGGVEECLKDQLKFKDIGELVEKPLGKGDGVAKVGYLSNKIRVISRPTSSSEGGFPTLEIQEVLKTGAIYKIKIRYTGN